MFIDLKNGVSDEDVRKLLASKDDSQHRQLRVTKEGLAYLSDEVWGVDIDGLCFRLNLWVEGNSYTGLAASQDTFWVSKVRMVLEKNWPNPSSPFIDDY